MSPALFRHLHLIGVSRKNLTSFPPKYARIAEAKDIIGNIQSESDAAEAMRTFESTAGAEASTGYASTACRWGRGGGASVAKIGAFSASVP